MKIHFRYILSNSLSFNITDIFSKYYMIYLENVIESIECSLGLYRLRGSL